MHMLAALLTGRIPVDIFIFVEDCCRILVGAEGVSQVLNYRAGALVELYTISVVVDKPSDCCP
jgi:hypothetical protein